MNDTVITVVAIFLAGTLMFIFPLMSTADRSDDISQQVIQTEITEFADNIRSTGKITQDQYDNLVQTLGETGNHYVIDLEAQILDDSARKKTAQASSTKVGENEYISEFTSQIMSQMASNGEYTLKEGDIIMVRAKRDSKTIAEILKNFAYQFVGNSTEVWLAEAGGLVNVNGN